MSCYYFRSTNPRFPSPLFPPSLIPLFLLLTSLSPPFRAEAVSVAYIRPPSGANERELGGQLGEREREKERDRGMLEKREGAGGDEVEISILRDDR